MLRELIRRIETEASLKALLREADRQERIYPEEKRIRVALHQGSGPARVCGWPKPQNIYDKMYEYCNCCTAYFCITCLFHHMPALPITESSEHSTTIYPFQITHIRQ